MSSKKIITLFVGIEIAIVGIVLVSEGYSLGALQTITRFSGRLSLFLFSAIFLLHNKPAPITLWLSEKYYLLFAVVHGIHLVELLTYGYLSDMRLIPHRLAGGFLAYLFIFSMPALQYYRDQKRITEKAFSTLQIVFAYYVWLSFFLTYLPRVQGKLPQAGGSFAEHVALLGWTSALLGMKLTGLIQFQKRKMD